MDVAVAAAAAAPHGLPPVPAAALNAAAQPLAVEGGVDDHEPAARTPLGDGRWVAVRADRLLPSAAISVSVEPTTPTERIDLCVRSFGMTTREADLVRRVARGLDTADTDWTRHALIRDPAGAVFTKTGVTSGRPEAMRATQGRHARGSPSGPETPAADAGA